MMDRSPRRAGLVAAASVGGWALLGLLSLLRQAPEATLAPRRAAALRFARFSSSAASAWALQLSLFFSLPFYLRASAWLFGHTAFVVLVAGAGALTLWDPILERVLARPWSARALQAIASFSGLGVVLPILGVSNRASMWAAAALTAGALLVISAFALRERARELWRAGVVALGIPVALALGGARAIPAAPLRLVDAAIGKGLAERAAVGPLEEASERPAQLVCSSIIAAPRGLKDALFHVWSKDGHRLDRIALEVEGGRAVGFRTYSIKRNLGPSPEGRWTCAVETASGQLLGEREGVVPPSPAGPALPPAVPALPPAVPALPPNDAAPSAGAVPDGGA